jgi:hypothetical protein
MRSLLLLPLVLVACSPSTTQNPTPQAPAASPAPSASSSLPEGAVAAPVFSDDACTTDADCAPVGTCHPAGCVAAAKSGTNDLMCTMECRAGTTDCGYNHCGCAAAPSGKKTCALLPGPKS